MRVIVRMLASDAIAAVGATRSLLTDVTQVVSTVHDTLIQVKLNDVFVARLRFKTRGIQNILQPAQETVEKYHWLLDERFASELKNELELVQELLNVVHKQVTELVGVSQKKFKKYMKAKSSKVLLEDAENELMDIEKRAESIKTKANQLSELIQQRSAVVAKGNRPIPHSIDCVRAEPVGKYMHVEWVDCINDPNNLKGYDIFVSGIKMQSVDLRESTDSSSSTSKYSLILNEPFPPWRTYHVEVCAVNEANQPGGRSNPEPVRMNQHPPTVQPTGITVNATSKTSVRLTIDHPEKYDEMGISNCRIIGFANNYADRVRWDFIGIKFCSKTSAVLLDVDGFDPTWEYALNVYFCNKYGTSEPSKEVKFKIESMEPSKPLLQQEVVSHNSVALRWLTEINAGSVDRYLLVEVKGKSNDLRLLLTTHELHHEVKGLESNTVYSFMVKSVFKKDSGLCYKQSDRVDVTTL